MNAGEIDTLYKTITLDEIELLDQAYSETGSLDDESKELYEKMRQQHIELLKHMMDMYIQKILNLPNQGADQPIKKYKLPSKLKMFERHYIQNLYEPDQLFYGYYKTKDVFVTVWDIIEKMDVNYNMNWIYVPKRKDTLSRHLNNIKFEDNTMKLRMWHLMYTVEEQMMLS